MNIFQQVGATLWAPLSIFRIGVKGLARLVVYVVLSGLVLGGVGYAIASHREALRDLVLGYLFPKDWHFAAKFVLGYFFESQQQLVLLNAMVSGSLIVVSMTLFWAKESLSAAFERDAELTPHPKEELPLLTTLLEELKLAVFYLTAFMTIFWIGYAPDPTRQRAALYLSYGFVFLTYGIDFTAPLMQRHSIRYSQLLKTLLKHPLSTFGFGAMFALPPVLLGNAVMNEGWSFEAMAAATFGVEVLTIAWAAVAGTYLGSRLVDGAMATPVSARASQTLGWAVVSCLFAVNVYAFGALGVSVHHKSQALKCSYDVDWESARLEQPDLGALIGGEAEERLSFGLAIRNPTPFDLELERNRLEVRHGETLVATSSLTPVRVASGQTVERRLTVPLELHTRTLLKGLELLDDRWTVTLYLDVAPHIELPIYVRSVTAK